MHVFFNKVEQVINAVFKAFNVKKSDVNYKFFSRKIDACFIFFKDVATYHPINQWQLHCFVGKVNVCKVENDSFSSAQDQIAQYKIIECGIGTHHVVGAKS